MFSRRSLHTLSAAERQFLRQQNARTGECIRCFHASRRQRAEGDGPAGSGKRNVGSDQGNDQGTPYNKPNRGPSRQQRSAKVSEEVRMLNRDTPNLGPTKPPNDGADFTAPPAATKPENAPPGRMGENMPPEREGPLNQGAVSRPLRDAGEEQVGAIKGNMNVRPDSAAQPTPEVGFLDAASAGGQGTIAQKRAQDPEEQDEEGEEQEEQDEAPDMVTKKRPDVVSPSGPRLPMPGTPFIAATLTREGLKTAGDGASTIAAGNFEGVLNDRLKVVTEPGNDVASRDVHYLAQKLLNRQLVYFRSEDEIEATLEECKRITGRGALLTEQEYADLNLDATQPYFTPFPEGVRKTLVNHMVNGQYDSQGLFAGKAPHKQEVLNEVEKNLMRNGTYLNSDSSRLLQKVRSLLPVATPQKGGAGGAAPQGKEQQKQEAKA
ncbi:hypothetical protein KC343_g4914 [Hortaea werneckii]|uniref:Uncharacterized protein n=1 Tax=Hortaea werneckii TaxID=91943 RepID=A0A3M7H9Z7_HORWE|nr:hypothetical protein KC338_g7926 [Hortaea werneckii]KAI6859688.1 hypothetical protein KC323_g6498 [Hortaea werneckii]KAI7349192.1 hypothetical protein KC320_g6191 [Hortaea werneckii]KAI7569089.1 hypothetical protein KC317_g3620 [Hortaea werneckii]KAI7621972.1 hypothetical protein KC346_g3425 [Hortaea werneckii]